MAPKIFSVVKLSGVLEPARNSYVIVPTPWINSKDDGSVTVPYPSADQLEIGFERIISGQPALAEWNEYQGVVEREAGNPLDHSSTSLIWFSFVVNFYRLD